ncbi:uncharacterized protein LOC143601209 [Bidens hawaiensis]|uniref:uncharacterized protein LOC143601209 n=1 Tax=Bidens hawaiensis TaxID=980011 RepID=UPI004049C451
MNLRDQGTSGVLKVGRTVILPSSFTGGARYMTQNYLDAMTLCKWFGYPDFFITVMCNPKWPEMTRFLKDTTLNSEDRPDILCILFKIKLDALLKDLKDKAVLGKVQAAWRIFGYDVHYRMPSVTLLPFHLPGQQHVVYGADDDLDNVLEKVESVFSSMFTGWMKCNEKYASARKLTYVELPTEFVWHAQPHRWERRKSGFSIGRIHTVSPAAGEADACYSLGLLEDDQEYIEAIEEASHSSLGHGVRALFATMLSTDSLSRPEHVWINTCKWLSDDILYNQRRLLKSPELSLTEDQIKNLTLFEIEKILLRNNSSLRKYQTMPFPDAEYISIASNSLIQEDLAYDQNLQKLEFQTLFNSVTNEQKNVFDRILMAVQPNKGVVFFVYGYGGTEKTYLWKTLSTAIRSKGEIVLTVASSGITSLLINNYTSRCQELQAGVG